MAREASVDAHRMMGLQVENAGSGRHMPLVGEGGDESPTRFQGRFGGREESLVQGVEGFPLRGGIPTPRRIRHHRVHGPCKFRGLAHVALLNHGPGHVEGFEGVAGPCHHAGVEVACVDLGPDDAGFEGDAAGAAEGVEDAVACSDVGEVHHGAGVGRVQGDGAEEGAVVAGAGFERGPVDVGEDDAGVGPFADEHPDLGVGIAEVNGPGRSEDRAGFPADLVDCEFGMLPGKAPRPDGEGSAGYAATLEGGEERGQVRLGGEPSFAHGVGEAEAGGEEAGVVGVGHLGKGHPGFGAHERATDEREHAFQFCEGKGRVLEGQLDEDVHGRA